MSSPAETNAERFARIVAGADESINVAEAALLVAAEEYRDLDVDAYLSQLDDMATILKRRLRADISQGVTDQLNLDGVGSGSGLLDLTRESDDTSLGAELLDEIAPGKTRAGGTAAGESAVGTGLAGQADTRGARAGLITVEARDTTAGAFGGAALAASLFLLVGALVLTSAVVGTRPGLVETLTKQSFIVVFGIGLGLALIFGIIGLLVGKSAR